MRNRFWFHAFLLALVVTLPFTVLAQESAVKGSLGGVVVDQSGAVVTGAKVTITGPTGSTSMDTNPEGGFLFQSLTPGSYNVHVEKQGFKGADVKGSEVATNRTASLRVSLQPGAVSETVEVTATAGAVDTSATAVSTSLGDSFYGSVPVARGVAGLFYIAPGVASGGGTGQANPSISGGSGLENLYIADGVNITDT